MDKRRVISLDDEDFWKFLKRGGRFESAGKRVIAQMSEYERFLREKRSRKRPDNATPEDLEAFVSFAEEKKKGSAKKYLHSIHYYYEYNSNEKMLNLARNLRRQKITQKPFPLKDFRGVNPTHVKKLVNLGIRNVKDMLEAGRTRKKREELATKAGIPAEAILELVKLSDLARIQGVKSIRARLYHDAGVDTIEKMATWNPQKLRIMLIDFVEKTGFKGIAPLPKEAEFTVAEAKKLARIVEY
jgi:hypothetical protein